MMESYSLPTPSQDDIENMLEHLRGLGQRADPGLHPDGVDVWVDDVFTIIQRLNKQQHVEHLLTKCLLFPTRLSMETEYGCYVLIYHHESDPNKDLNIVGCAADHENVFWALRTATTYYAHWVRHFERDELAARKSEEADNT